MKKINKIFLAFFIAGLVVITITAIQTRTIYLVEFLFYLLIVYIILKVFVKDEKKIEKEKEIGDEKVYTEK